MKKIMMLLIMAALLLPAFPALADADFTLLVYMCGTDLQSDACYDIYEMGLAENSENVNIVVLAGGASEWDFEDIPGDTHRSE